MMRLSRRFSHSMFLHSVQREGDPRPAVGVRNDRHPSHLRRCFPALRRYLLLYHNACYEHDLESFPVRNKIIPPHPPSRTAHSALDTGQTGATTLMPKRNLTYPEGRRPAPTRALAGTRITPWSVCLATSAIMPSRTSSRWAALKLSNCSRSGGVMS